MSISPCRGREYSPNNTEIQDAMELKCISALKYKKNIENVT